MTSPEREPEGLVCLADGAVAEWFTAFGRSLRRYLPDLPVALIPFRERSKELERMARDFDFSIWEPDMLGELDELGRRFYPDHSIAPSCFRKLACFWGPFDRFVYLDVDVVVLGRGLMDLLAAFRRGALDLAFYNGDLDQVYKPGTLRRALERKGAQGFNTGFLISRRGLLDRSRMYRLAEEALGLRDHLTDCYEQPFLNFIADRSGWSVQPAVELVPRLAPITWCKIEIERRGDRYFQHWEGELRELPFVHWAGSRLPAIEHPDLFLRFRTMGDPWPERALHRLRWWWSRRRG